MFRAKPSPQSAINQQKYIPPSVQQAINKQLNSKLPGYMQQYTQSGYVPPQAQKLIAKQMENLPTHLKEYSGAYMEQNVLHPLINSQPAMATATAGAATTLRQPPPMPNLMRQDRSSFVPGEQPQARLMNGSFASAEPTAAAAGPGAVPPSSAPTTNYDFFMSSTSPQPSKFNILGGQSLRKRLFVVAAGLIVLIIVIVAASSLFGGKSNAPQLIAIAQDQNELVRVATEASEQQTAEQTTQNLAQSIQLSLTSAQQQLLTYLKSNGQTIGATQLAATKNTKTDQELTAAQAASNFDPVFGQVVQTGLQSYIQAIKAAYSTTGPKGKVLLKAEYDGATLLLNQTNSVISSLQSQ